MPVDESETVVAGTLPATIAPRPVVTRRRVATGDVALGVLGATVTASRSLAARAPHVPGAVLARLPLPAPLSRIVQRGWLAAGARGRADEAAAVDLVRHLADVLVPRFAREILSRLDVVALVQEFVDVNRIAALLDVDTVAARLDLDAVVARLDLDAVVDRLDIDRIIDRLDLDALAARLDLDAVVDRLDIDRILDRLDLDTIVDRVDIDRAAARIELNAIVDRLDLDRVIGRLDVIGLAEYVVDGIDLPGVIRSSTGSMTTEMVRGVRVQGADADRAVERLVDRLLLRHHARRTADGRPDGPSPDGAPPRSAPLDGRAVPLPRDDASPTPARGGEQE